jgi:serine protease DegS/serine protease DegQ
MRRIWLLFTQAVTISVAVLFVLDTLKPDWRTPTPAPASPIIREATANTSDVSGNGTVSYAHAARRALPSVVYISTSKAVRPRSPNPLWNDPIFRHFFGNPQEAPQRRSSGLGSGVIVSPEGYILTNNHVVESADEIEVALQDGRKFGAKIVGRDPDTDLAVLKIRTETPLPSITFAAKDSLHIGDVVLAIGNPFGVGQTVTMGIVSALGRSHLGINTFENFIQTDAAINPGNSGGALVDTLGNLVGVNSAIYSRSGGSLGIGFAIPISLARNVMDQIIQKGSVTRGWIGVETQALSRGEGVLIAGILRGAPADEAGLRPGDILKSVDNTAITTPQKMLEVIAALEPGKRSRFTVLRDTQILVVNIQIGRRPAPIQNEVEE